MKRTIGHITLDGVLIIESTAASFSLVAASCTGTPYVKLRISTLVYILVGLCVVLYLPYSGLQSAFKGTAKGSDPYITISGVFF